MRDRLAYENKSCERNCTTRIVRQLSDLFRLLTAEVFHPRKKNAERHKHAWKKKREKNRVCSFNDHQPATLAPFRSICLSKEGNTKGLMFRELEAAVKGVNTLNHDTEGDC